MKVVQPTHRDLAGGTVYMADGVSDSDGPVFCCEEDCRNSAILQTTLNKATRRRDRNDNSFRVALVRIETQALAAFQMSDFSSQPAAVVTSVDALAGAVRAAQHAHGAAMRLAERVGRYSERMKFLRAVQAAKDDMRKMKDTLAIYSRVIRTYQLTNQDGPTSTNPACRSSPWAERAAGYSCDQIISVRNINQTPAPISQQQQKHQHQGSSDPFSCCWLQEHQQPRREASGDEGVPLCSWNSGKFEHRCAFRAGEESSKPETHREMREAPTKFSEAFDSVQTDFCAGIKNSQDRNLSLGNHLPGTHLMRIGNRKRNQAVFKSISQKLLVLQTQYENTPVIRDELGWKHNPSLTGSGNHSSECLGSSTCCYRQRQKPEKAGATPAASQQQAAYDTASKSCTELQQEPEEEEEEAAAAAVETEARTSADTRIRGQSLLRDALCFLFGAIIFNLVRVFVSSHQDMFRPWGVPT